MPHERIERRPSRPSDQFPSDQFPSDQFPSDQFPSDQFPGENAVNHPEWTSIPYGFGHRTRTRVR
jgi:hypothetical protein